MREAWETKRLADVAEMQGRIGWKGLTAKEYTPEGPYFLSVHSLNYGDFVDFRDAFHISQSRYDESPEIMLQRDDVLICKDGAGIGKVGIVGDIPGPSTINSSLLLIRAKPNILPKYLYLILQSPYFQEIVQSRLEGATTPHLYQRDIATFPIHLPSLDVQRRIVAVLDEAFAAIGTATVNAKRNLANSGELFSSVVSSTLSPGADGLQRMSFGAFCQLQRGFDLPTKERRTGSVPLVSSSGVIDAVDRAMVAGPGVITGRSGSIGNVFFEKEDFWPLNTTLYVKNFFGNAPRFVYHFLRAFDLSRYATGTGVPTLNRNFVNDVAIWVPLAAVQQRLADAFDEIEGEVESVSRTYEAKIAELERLKQSLLHRAFSGELTEREPLAA